MNRQNIDPVLRAAVRDELEQLPTRAAAPRTRSRSSQHEPPRVRSLVVTGITAAVVIACSAVVIHAGQARTAPAADRPASSTAAEAVTFDGSPAQASHDEHALATFLLSSGRDQSPSDRAALQAVQASPQLRLDPSRYTNKGFVVIGTAAGGGNSDGSPSTSWFAYGDPTGYYGTGGPTASQTGRIESLLMRCPGSGTYTWTLQGRTATNPRIHALAQAVGRCGSALTTTRYRLEKGTETTSMTIESDSTGGEYNAAIMRWVPSTTTAND